MALVWLTEWEWACCGEPFGVGDRVEWRAVGVRPSDAWLGEVLGTELAGEVSWAETHHETSAEEEVPLAGVVRGIRAVFADRASTAADPVSFVVVPGTAAFRDLERLDRDVIGELADASSMTLLDGGPVPPPRPEDLVPLAASASPGRTDGGATLGWFAAAGPRPARRSRSVQGYLVEVEASPDFGRDRPV
ncbi:DUF6578 domain-containing protein [Agromyces sp. MMS24-K17]|uniref:DUF6578 domain-containing protein n=1 Tax=Agromyces sp. MMS24-K17 TaxID=3372850 RepID=UPI003754E19F